MLTIKTSELTFGEVRRADMIVKMYSRPEAVLERREEVFDSLQSDWFKRRVEELGRVSKEKI